MSEIEKNRKHTLNFLDKVREDIMRATDFNADLDMSKPSLRAAAGEVAPIGYYGTNHIQYNMRIDVLLPHTLAIKEIEQ